MRVLQIGQACWTSVSLCALATAAFAQPAPVAPVEEEPAQDVVIVTATKREQTLQSVPVAVSVTSAKAIEQAQVRDLNDLQTLVPSLRVGQLQSSANTNFIIRGFGNGANNLGIESSVGVFIDGVYRSRSASAISDLPNMQRVEVLRGPQSTLFGKNASAGVISVVTREPQFEWGGNAELSFGNYNAFVAKGDVTGPLSENVAFSLAAGANVREGYATDINLNIDTNERNRWFVRGQLLWEPTETIKFRLIADHDKIDEICCVAANVLDGPTGNAVRAIGGKIKSNDPFSYEVYYNFPSTNDIENSGISLQGNFDFGKLDVTSITAYRMTEGHTNQDSDFTSADIIGANVNNSQIKTFTQELRLTSSFDGPLNFLLGAYYFDEAIESDGYLTYGKNYRAYSDLLAPNAVATIEALSGLPRGFYQREGQGRFEEYTLDNTAYSIFGSVDFDVTEKLTLTAGFNYTDDKKESTSNNTTTDTFSTIDLDAFVYNVFVNGAVAQTVGTTLGLGRSATATEVTAFAGAQPAAYNAIVTGSRNFASSKNSAGVFNYANTSVNAAAALLGAKALQFLPQFLNYPNVVEDGKTADDKLTYSFRLAYEINDNFNAYVSYGTGFKASSINLSTDSRPFASDFIAGSPVTNPPASRIRTAGINPNNLTSGTRYAGPEESTVTEVGIKAKFSRLAWNLTVFDQTIEGFQSNAFTGTGFALVNAGSQSTKGVEFDSTFSPIRPLTLTGAVTWLDPLYDSFVGSINGDLSGTKPAGIPEWSVSLGANYVHSLGNGGRAIFNVDYFWNSEYRLSESFPASYTTQPINLSASATYVFPRGLEMTVWGRNITDEQYITTLFPGVAQSGTISGYPNQPRTYGVALRQRF
jgi:iron complex outermembrane recepter protein